MKFVTTCLLLSLIFFTKVYAEEPIGFVTEIKGKVKKINGDKKEIQVNIYDQLAIDQLVIVEKLASVTFATLTLWGYISLVFLTQPFF